MGSADPALPYDDRPSLVEFAKRAELALREHMQTTGFNYDDRAEREHALMQLLSDLQHFANREGFDFDDAVAEANVHWSAEIEGEDGTSC